MAFKGGCCDCQSSVFVRVATQSELQVLAEVHGHTSMEEFIREFGKGFRYVCEDHEAYGSHCIGSGQIPQGIDFSTLYPPPLGSETI